MARMKTLPKILLIGVAVGAVIFGINFAMSKMPKKEEVKADPVVTTTVPAESAQPTTPPPNVATPPVAEAPPAAPALTPAPSNDAGLANVINSGKK